jgi:hypothetical protein
MGRRGSARPTLFWSRTAILLFIALVLAHFTYAEKLTVIFWFENVDAQRD